METIGLRELNRNPSKAVARVRAGASLLVTDRGKPLLRMVPEVEPTTLLQRMIASGEVEPPVDMELPEVIEDLLPDVPSVADLIIAEREAERAR